MPILTTVLGRPIAAVTGVVTRPVGRWLARSGEPVYIMAALNAAIVLVMAFGLNLTGKQVSAIDAFAAAILAIIFREAVTPIPPSP